jgi:hypothetical protein
LSRIVLIGWAITLVCGCASNQPQEGTEPAAIAGNVFARSPVQPPDAAAARESDVSPVVAPSPPGTPPPAVPAATTGKMELLGEISDSTPGAADIPVTRRPCNLDACAVVLGITTQQVAESLADDDGGPGTYIPEGMTSMATAGEPGVWDAYGVEKLVPVWVITVQTSNGTVRVVRQRNSPAFSVGDSVLVDGDTILPWN